MQAASVQHRTLVVVSHDHEVDVAHQCAQRLPVGDFAPHRERVSLHLTSGLFGSNLWLTLLVES